MDHTYEEIRDAALDVLSGRESVPYEPSQYEHIRIGVAEVFARREGTKPAGTRHFQAQLSARDADLFLEVFWGLFREGILTLGYNDSNREFPFCRLSTLGRDMTKGANSYLFHDAATYQKVIQEAVPTIDKVTLVYLLEAMQAFRAGCLLSASVMLGVAAEHTFLLTLEAAENRAPWKTRFANVGQERTILRKINKFKNILDQHTKELDPVVREDLDTNFAGILAVVRNFRNDSGHPTGKFITREQVYVLLQLFVAYCKKLYQLKEAF
ncbi:MAG: hypothetical protein Q8Q14_01150 [Gemmatimonadales bacterium]|nr:hypothetical protein [Gemmatimonadales bacterium]